MISRLRGILAEKAPGEVVVDVGGVGYGAFVSLSTFCRLPDVGAEVELVVITNLRDNALELFAFAEARERALFQLLRGVSGIGPRLALSILSGIEPGDLHEVLQAGSVERLVAIPGVGRKTAERIVVELRDRIEPASSEGVQPTDVEGDAVLALVALGYKQGDARKAVKASRDGDGVGQVGIEALIKRSLAHLRP